MEGGRPEGASKWNFTSVYFCFLSIRNRIFSCESQRKGYIKSLRYKEMGNIQRMGEQMCSGNKMALRSTKVNG